MAVWRKNGCRCLSCPPSASQGLLRGEESCPPTIMRGPYLLLCTQEKIKFLIQGMVSTECVLAHLVISSFTLLCSADFVIFHKSKVCGNPVWSQPIGALFPKTFACFMSLCNSCSTSNFLIITMFPMVVCDQWLQLTKSSGDGIF